MELAILGWSQHQISADIGVSQAAVSKILQRVETRTLRELTATVERQKARHTLRLEHLYAQAMRAWEESKADNTRRRQRKTQAGQGGAGATVAEVVVEQQHGDPRYLDEARKVLADHRKLWGLDAPQKVDVRASRNPHEGWTEAALRDELARQARLLDSGDPTGSGTVEATTSSATTPEVPTDGSAH